MYPVMMNIQNKPVVVIGGGKVAARKIKTLLSEGAKVTVISPKLNEEIQQHLFDCGSDLATPRELRPYKQKESDITFLEEKMDAYMHIPEKIDRFIIPGGHRIASLFHVARTMTRRLERKMVAVIEADETVNEVGLIYINRLSDYFFVAARLVNHRLDVKDTVYKRSAKIFRERKEEK